MIVGHHRPDQRHPGGNIAICSATPTSSRVRVRRSASPTTPPLDAVGLLIGAQKCSEKFGLRLRYEGNTEVSLFQNLACCTVLNRRGRPSDHQCFHMCFKGSGCGLPLFTSTCAFFCFATLLLSLLSAFLSPIRLRHCVTMSLCHRITLCCVLVWFQINGEDYNVAGRGGQGALQVPPGRGPRAHRPPATASSGPLRYTLGSLEAAPLLLARCTFATLRVHPWNLKCTPLLPACMPWVPEGTAHPLLCLSLSLTPSLSFPFWLFLLLCPCGRARATAAWRSPTATSGSRGFHADAKGGAPSWTLRCTASTSSEDTWRSTWRWVSALCHCTVCHVVVDTVCVITTLMSRLFCTCGRVHGAGSWHCILRCLTVLCVVLYPILLLPQGAQGAPSGQYSM